MNLKTYDGVLDEVRLHVIFAFLLVELTFLLGGGVLVLLVLGDEVVEVGLGLGELHLVHALAGVPVEERLALELRGRWCEDTPLNYLQNTR